MSTVKKDSLNILKSKKLRRLNSLDHDIFGVKTSNSSFKNVNIKAEIEKSIDNSLRNSSPFFYGLKNKEFVSPHFKSEVNGNDKKYVPCEDPLKSEIDRTKFNYEQLMKKNHGRVASLIIEKKTKINLNKRGNYLNKSVGMINDKNNSILEIKDESNENEGCVLDIPDKNCKKKSKVIKDKIKKREEFSMIASSKIIENNNEVQDRKTEFYEKGTFHFLKEKRIDHIMEKAKKRADVYEQIQDNFLTNGKICNESIGIKPSRVVEEKQKADVVEVVVSKKNKYYKDLNDQLLYKNKTKKAYKLKEEMKINEALLESKLRADKNLEEKQSKLIKLKEEFKTQNQEIIENKQKESFVRKTKELREGEEIIRKDKELHERITKEKMEKDRKNKKEIYTTLNKQVEEKKSGTGKTVGLNKSRSVATINKKIFVSKRDKTDRISREKSNK